jgi:DNA-binding MarR family transcriptional regulator
MPPQPDDAPLSEARVAEVAAFRTALHRFERRTGVAARASGLTPQRYLMLLTIWGSRDGSSTVTGIADALDLPQTTVSDMVARAIDVGLVERRPSADGRSALLAVTAEGKRRVAVTARRLERDRSLLRASLEAAMRLLPPES